MCSQASLVMNLLCDLNSVNLTNAGVKACVCSEDITGREVNSVAGKAEKAADRFLWLELWNSLHLGR